MAFQVKNWTRVSSSGNTDVVTLQDGTLTGAPTFFAYISGVDTVATIAAADYFAQQANELNQTDLIYVAGTDTEVFLTVVGVGLGPPATVVTAYVTPASGDVVGPASATANDIAVFNGVTGKIIKDGGVTIGGVQAGSLIYAADAGATDAYAITLSPVPAAYVTGMMINFKANTANTGTASLNVNGLGAKTIVKAHDQTLATGDIEAGQIVTVVYDGTNFQMQSETALTLPSGASGTVLQGQGLGSNPAYSTATYPATTTVSEILYSSASNTVSGLATANSGVLTTNATGIPAITALSQDGQLIIGSGAGAPAAAILTAGSGISITNGPNTITIAASGGGLTWNDQTTTPVTMAASNAYSANNAGLVTLNTPATAAFGDVFEVAGQGAGGWLIQANTGQTINMGSSPTTVAGSLASTNRYDGVTLVCTVANTTFVVTASMGNITVA